jgi:predicted phage terminase large subunit-like protein
MAWRQVEPAREFLDNWHIAVICEHLEAVSRGEIRRLVINQPPGSMKTLNCSVFWPAWEWANRPRTKWITASYSDRVARRDSLRARNLMETSWYQERWGHVWKPNKDDWSSIRYSNSQAGFRMATTVGGAAVGEHADIQLVDDPIKPLDAREGKITTAALEANLEWWDGTMTTRVVDPEKSCRVIMMQRLHHADLAGEVLKSGGYDHLCLPMEAEKPCVVQVPHKCSLQEGTTIGFVDPRPEGELLWEARYPPHVLKRRHEEMGSPRVVAAQDQQRPTPAGGGTFKREYINFWSVFPVGGEMVQSWDCSFKDLASSSYVVGQVWVRIRGQFYLVDQVRDQMNVSSTCKAILSMSSKWPKARKKLIEDKANGPAVIQLMKKDVPGLKAVTPEGGKDVRANAVEPLWASGNVFIPSPNIAPWVHDFIEELVNFGAMRHDDQVDAMSQALTYLYGRTVANYKDAMKNFGEFTGLFRRG